MNLLRCLGDCLLLRGPGRDVTDPSDRHRGGGGWVRRGKGGEGTRARCN